jgi:hypothetical protein
MNIRKLATCVFLAFTGFGCAAVSPRPAVLHYEPADVQLSGVVKLELKYGAPNYGENPESDSRDLIALLELDAPVSVARNVDDELNGDSFEDIREIQLVFLDRSEFCRYSGMHVIVRGNLFEGITAHHYTHVLVIVRRIEIRR